VHLSLLQDPTITLCSEEYDILGGFLDGDCFKAANGLKGLGT